MGKERLSPQVRERVELVLATPNVITRVDQLCRLARGQPVASPAAAWILVRARREASETVDALRREAAFVLVLRAQAELALFPDGEKTVAKLRRPLEVAKALSYLARQAKRHAHADAAARFEEAAAKAVAGLSEAERLALASDEAA